MKCQLLVDIPAEKQGQFVWHAAEEVGHILRSEDCGLVEAEKAKELADLLDLGKCICVSFIVSNPFGSVNCLSTCLTSLHQNAALSKASAAANCNELTDTLT